MKNLYGYWIYYKTRIKTKFIRGYFLAKYGLDKTVRTFPQNGGKYFASIKDIHTDISAAIENGEPCMVGRFGSVELQTAIEEYLKIDKYIDRRNKQLATNAGFFPTNKENIQRYSKLMIDSMQQSDVQGVWYLCYEDYTIKNIMPKHTRYIEARYLEPWFYPSAPWTKSLKGKRVVVVHPFVQTIKQQYEKRKLIFPANEDYLPEFELITVKAVQTAAGERDSRFKTWFDALNYMYEEVMKNQFDVAIIGCGAYGYPLAAMIKQAGKIAIHLGGVVQAMFGIKGKRWEDDPNPIIRNLYNEHWVAPSEQETPAAAKSVEGGCYW